MAELSRLQRARMFSMHPREEFVICYAAGWPDPFTPVPNTLEAARKFQARHGGIIKSRYTTDWVDETTAAQATDERAADLCWEALEQAGCVDGIGASEYSRRIAEPGERERLAEAGREMAKILAPLLAWQPKDAEG